MKKRMLGFFLTAVFAAFLVCDPQLGVTSYKLEVNGVEDATTYLAEADGSAKIAVDSYSAGNYTFRLKAIGEGGWPSDWSDPFNATKPLRSGNVRIEDQ
jgi:hypothetical protein